ncbi:PhzF family phenazine biosynthesis isomerase [Nakamurella sp. YIM 132087]|uniref:PhzF family phenazine biosynthesis isomerase n=1 Tax=Nakamurella alba TaxID=2665158 RepID=A0A7K1FVA3_9ACTN|nr:PhzF family phenazine biosynthesis protein [Nakamurella alba]MTD17299.1 PhzF family phenazine biosynthesis isomerase [Nakamurella alba]
MEILRYTAFSSDPSGGNPAGVVLDATGATDAEMQRIAADLGYSESAFLFPSGPGRARIRYFSPLAEVDFCGHATIATAVALAEQQGAGPLVLDANPGEIEVATQLTDQGMTATLVSVVPQVSEIAPAVIAELLACLRLTEADLDPELPVRQSFSGNLHPVVAVSAEALESLDQDQDALAALMYDHGWGATVAVVHRLSDDEFVARNPFPPGGVREDPATGSAAAALGGYLRAIGAVTPPARIVVQQGAHIGRPGRLVVDIPEAGGISVTGTAVPIAE